MQESGLFDNYFWKCLLIGCFLFFVARAFFKKLDCLTLGAQLDAIDLALPLGQVDEKIFTLWGAIEKSVGSPSLKIVSIPPIITT